MYSELYALAKTDEELETLRQELDELSESLFQAQGAFEEVLGKSVRPATSQTISKLFSEGKLRDWSKFLQDSKKALELVKILELTIVFDPKQEVIERIWLWVRKNVGEGVVIKFNVDRSIGAGAVLVYEGKYRNYSLKKKLDDYFASRSQDVSQILA
jgi:F0F1-type ATP synthase delta subunit